jgi:hypothetical protein
MIFNKPKTQTADSFVIQLGKSAKKKVHPERLSKINDFLNFLDLEDSSFMFLSRNGIERFWSLFYRG